MVGFSVALPRLSQGHQTEAERAHAREVFELLRAEPALASWYAGEVLDYAWGKRPDHPIGELRIMVGQRGEP